MSKYFDVAVLGGGASGVIAAISSKRLGRSMAILEKMPRIGKKLLISGAGRCNLSNEKLDEVCYNEGARPFIKSVFSRFGEEDIREFFQGLGLHVYSEEGKVFPITNQAATVVRLLEMEIRRLKIDLELNFDVTKIRATKEGFNLHSKDGKEIVCSRLILAGGGRTYPALGSDGSAYKFATQFGHKIVEPVPSAVGLVVKDRIIHLLQGQKIRAKVKAVITGKVMAGEGGDLLFTNYGLSGTAIMDISRDISIAINRNRIKDVLIIIDMVPFIHMDALRSELDGRIKNRFTMTDLLAGILPNKFGLLFKDLVSKTDAAVIASGLKERKFRVIGTRGWNEAEFTAGGVALDDVKETTLESKLRKGLYFSGEILDVDGRRGGYNLAWAWASGFAAGRTE